MRCASWARQEQVDPIGTATAADGFLLVGWPLPWPRDASEVEALAPVHEALAGTGIRLQLVVPDPEAPTRSVVLHRRRPDDDGWFAGFERRAVEVAPGEVAGAAAALARGELGGAGRPAGSAGGSDGPAVDVLVCGHGARDRCCGSMGTGLVLEVGAAGSVAVRRTSHTGGHRFAPTGLVLPDGTAWAFLDADALARVATRTGPLDDLLPRYRGSTGLAPRAVQALERAAFAEVGWAWLDHRRRGRVLEDGTVMLEAVAPDGNELAWQGEVAERRLLPVPDCGKPVEEAKKSEPELAVVAVNRVR